LMFLGNSSATWLGVLKATTNASSASSAVQQAIMEDCGMSGSTAATSAMVDYSSFDRPKFVRCAFSAISGRALYNSFLTGGSVTTLIELDQCVFVYCRQVISIFATTKVQFDSCSFESSTVVGAFANTVADFNSCYFENVGQTWGGYTTGIENKDLGFSGGAVLQTPITSVINTIGSENTFVSCTFNYRNAVHAALYATSANVYPVGIPTGVYTGCSVNFIGARILDNNSGSSFFETQVDAQQNLVNYSWMSGIFSPEKLSATDIRKLTNGNLYVDFTGTNPSQPTMVDVRNGQFIVSGTSFSTSLGFPGGNPTGDTWKVGDRIYYASPAPSAANGSQGIGAVNVVAGSPGSWVVFGTLDSGTLTNVTTATYTVLITDTNLIVNYAGTCTVTLPNPAFAFRRLTFRTIQNQGVNSSGLNVTSLAGVAGGSTILTNTAGKWATIISDGTAWQIQQAN